MSQVLEKPILLDETGQAIAGKLDTNSAAIIEALDDIKDAIGTSSEFIPVSLRVITPPTKTIYKVGERLDLTGMVVNLIGSNGVQIDVTSACTFNPANGTSLTTSDTSIAISYVYQHDGTTFTTSQALTIRELSNIAVTTPPIKTAYQTGETLDLTGIVVTATYSDGFTANVTNDCTFNPANGTVLSSSDTSVTVTYVEGSTTKTTSVAIGVKELVSIAVTHLPTKTAYRAGETLDLTGIVVTATYDDTSTLDVTAHCTFNPDDGDTLTTSDSSISISYTEGAITKTTSQVITVKELSSIAVTTPPTITEYDLGETLDLTGIVVTATYSDNSTADVTADCTFNPDDGDTLTTSDTSIAISYTEFGVTKTTTQSITVIAIYGVEWDSTSSPTLTRTDAAKDFVDPNPYFSGMSENPSSPFDNIAPWSEMTVTTIDGSTYVAIPKFYYKLTQENSKLKVQISPTPLTGYHISPAHMNRGDGEGERDVIYVGRYKSCNAAQSYKSVTGVTAYMGERSTLRTNLHTAGTDCWLWDYATYFTIQMLYLVEFAHWNSQLKIGRGEDSSEYVQNGKTDTMPYHTGTMATSRDTTGYATQYRNIEGPWDTLTYIDGCLKDAGYLYVCVNPSNFSDGSMSGAVRVGSASQADGWIKEMTVYTPSGAFPVFTCTGIASSSDAASGTTYICDGIGGYPSGGWDGIAVGNIARSNSNKSGIFAEKGSTDNLNGRLMKLPANS